MNIRLELWHGLVILVLLVLFGLTHTSVSPYYNNVFHGHRWRTDICKKAGLPIENCTIALPAISTSVSGQQKVISSETPMYDICLEHGEWRRIK